MGAIHNELGAILIEVKTGVGLIQLSKTCIIGLLVTQFKMLWIQVLFSFLIPPLPPHSIECSAKPHIIFLLCPVCGHHTPSQPSSCHSYSVIQHTVIGGDSTLQTVDYLNLPRCLFTTFFWGDVLCPKLASQA